MEKETRLRVKLTGDNKSLVGTVVSSKDAVEDFAKTTRDQTDGAKDGVRGLSAEFLQLQDTLDPTVGNTRRLAAATDLLDRELKQGNITVERHAQLMALANRRYTQARGGMMNMRMASQQLGYQVQDMAVQMQMGVNPIIALTQQGSQLAGVMGPGGALFGAVLAIGGAIAGGLVSSLSEASEEMDKLKERTDDLISDTLTAQIHKTRQDLESVKQQLKQFAAEFEQAGETRNRAFLPSNLIGLSPDEVTTKQSDANNSFEEARTRYLGAGEAVANLTKRLQDLEQQQAGTSDSTQNQSRAIREQQSELQSLIDTLFPAEAATRDYNAAVNLLENAIVQFPARADLYQRALDALTSRNETVTESLANFRLEIEGFNGSLGENLNLSTGFIQANMDEYYQKMEDAYQAHQDRIAVATQVTSYAFENAWVAALKSGEDMWKQFADTVIDQILRIQYQMTVGQGVQNVMNKIFGSIYSPAPYTSGAASFDGIGLTSPGTVPGLGTVDLTLGGRPEPVTASRAAPAAGPAVVINQTNDFSNVSTADEARIRQMLDENSRQTEARIYQNINRGGTAARTVGRR